jgi:NADPH-dependent 2,4-dienoyl-CoA reductase/sulfur reductase-like enzyme
MQPERLVIVGGVAAGMSAASRARRINPQMEIIVLEKGDFVSYGACGLAYYVSGVVANPDDLVVYTPEYFRDQRGLYVLTRHQAEEIRPGKKQVMVRQPSGDLVPTDYDRLVIAAGAAPAESIPGADEPGVFRCNNLPDAMALRTYLTDRRPSRGAVIGGGYIGLEIAEALQSHKVEVTVLERSESLMEDLDPEIDRWVEQWLRDHGVKGELNSPVRAIDPEPGNSLAVSYGDRRVCSTDVVVLATGLVPRAELAASAGIHLGTTGAIRTDNRQQTNLPGIYAAGDCVETINRVTGSPTYLPLGTTANKQGRVAGENAAGGNVTFPGIVGTLVTKVFELEVAKTGLSYSAARAAGFQPEMVKIDSRSQARYMKGKPLRVVLIVDRPSGRLLGAQMAGEEGAARRIDVVATALAAGMKVAEFVHMDLGYAPPFGPVYDPLLVAAWQALKLIGERR